MMCDSAKLITSPLTPPRPGEGNSKSLPRLRGSAGIRNCLAAAMILLMQLSALAVAPDEVLSDPVLEARARALSAQLRCLVCQNQSIDDSDAPLAKDLRLLVRKRLQAKDSDAAVMDYIVARYGDFVLLKPPMKSSTLLLWLTPMLVLMGAIWLAVKAGFGQMARAQGAESQTSGLSTAEEKRLAQILKQRDDT
jgi:cytochrome c-type biogenesis protein CcmH